MEVTSSNFKEVLPDVEKAIQSCTFLAIDCEFSGLNVVSEINAFDTPKQYYEKVLKNCRDFLVLQYGISAFRFDENEKNFKQQSYNFYIFRKPSSNNIPDQRFLCQTSSISFLTNQGFDFNKLFKLGIPYLNIHEEASYRERLQEKQKVKKSQNQHKDIVEIPEETQPFIDKILEKLDKFLEEDSAEMELPKCNAFVRRLVYQTVAQKYSNRISLATKQLKSKDRVLVATKFKTKEERDAIDEKLFEEELAVLDDFIGFTKVLRVIVDSGKLIVGHNMCLDFLHTIDKFLTPLSANYAEFKEYTKFIASSDEFRDLIPSTVLKDVLETVSKAPFQIPTVEIEKGGLGYAIEDLKEHEAGYDAYITGICFITMWNYLGTVKKIPTEQIFKDFTLMQPYINKLFLMVLRDSQYINLDGNDPQPSRDHVFYLTFPKDWKLTNIMELFSPFGGVYVSWINETSAYVGLHKKEQSKVALSTLSQSDTYSIMTYAKRQSLLHAVLPTGRKRTLDSTPQCNKKIKIDMGSVSKKRQQIESETENPKMCVKKEKKTFIESDAWD